MNLLVFRAAAWVGLLAHGLGRVLAGAAWFAPRAVPWVPIVAVLLGLWAWRSIEDSRAITAGAPRPSPVALADVVDLRAIGWVGLSTIVRGPYLDSASYGAPVQRWYYLLLDPHDPDVALVARSPSRLEERRHTDDRGARDDRSRGGGVRDRRHWRRSLRRRSAALPRRAGRAAIPLTGAGVVTPVSLASESGNEIVLRRAFERARSVDGGWEYVVRDRGRGVIVRSPYAPDALPVDVWGVAATDRLRTEQSLAVPELRAEAGDRRVPDGRLLAEGVTPPLPTVSYLPAMVFASVAALLALGWLLGYPLVRRRPLPDRIRTWPIAPDEEIPAELYGSDRRGPSPVVVDGAPARMALLAPDELDRRTWQFSLREAAGRAPSPGPTSVAGPARLALTSGQGPILLLLDPAPPGLRVGAVDVVHARSARPGLRLRADGLDLVATFASAAERDRAAVALDPARLAEEHHEPRPARAEPARQPGIGELSPMPLRVSASVLAAVGALLLVGGAIGVPAAVADPAGGLAPTVAQLAAGAGVLAVARAVWRRRDWAASIGFNVAWVGAAIAAFLIVASPQCGLWLAPNLAACEAAGPLGSAAALGAAIGLAYAALAIRRHSAAFVG